MEAPESMGLLWGSPRPLPFRATQRVIAKRFGLAA